MSFSRRHLIAAGATGFAGAIAMSHKADANVQQPIAAATTVNPQGAFADKVVLITGATSGIGEAAARSFAMEGAIVAVDGGGWG